MGWRLQSRLPMIPTVLDTDTSMKVRDSLVKQQQRSQLYHDRQSKPLTSLKPNEVVRVKHGSQWKPAVVIYKHTPPRSYIIKTADEKILRRNRQHLVKT